MKSRNELVDDVTRLIEETTRRREQRVQRATVAKLEGDHDILCTTCGNGLWTQERLPRVAGRLHVRCTECRTIRVSPSGYNMLHIPRSQLPADYEGPSFPFRLQLRETPR